MYPGSGRAASRRQRAGWIQISQKGDVPAGPWIVAARKRPKFGDIEYTQDEAWRDIEALERAVPKGPEAVDAFYEQRGGAAFTARALGIACRCVGLETVQALLAHGASFRRQDERRSDCDTCEDYLTMLLPRVHPPVRRKVRRNISPDERLEIARLLIEYDAGDLSELLYQAVLTWEFPIAEELLRAGVQIPERRRKLLDGSAGFTNAKERVHRRDRMDLRDAMYYADGAQLRAMIRLLRQCSGADRIAVYDGDVCPAYGAKRILAQFRSPGVFASMLKNTTMSTLVSRRHLIEIAAEQNDAESLTWLIDHGFVDRPSEIDLLLQLAADSGSAEMQAIALAHETARRPRKADPLRIPSDPYAASLMRQIWKYETANDGKSVRILHFKGKADAQSIVVPPRIGRRTVTQVSEHTFSPTGEPLPTWCFPAGSNAPFRRVLFQSVSFPGSIRSIPRCLGEHYQCADTLEIHLGDGTEEIRNNAFCQTSIRTIDVPDSVRSVGPGAFLRCSKLESARLSAALTDLADEMFCGCTALRNVTLPDGVRSIGRKAFAECASLPDAVLPDSVSTIGPKAFARTGITSVRVRAGVEYGEGVFENCAQLRAVEIEDGVVTLPDGMFRGCSQLAQIRLPETLEVIGARAFEGTALRELSIPPSVTTIGQGAFAQTLLRHIAVPDTVSAVGAGAFPERG